mmetsp:Transcript_99383/g.290084  ORF Transcript_99383/g.290084 Transcript_99383/m.290084 type:complete len:795 (+) Transcript_99383:112-2496(+)
MLKANTGRLSRSPGTDARSGADGPTSPFSSRRAAPARSSLRHASTIANPDVSGAYMSEARSDRPPRWRSEPAGHWQSEAESEDNSERWHSAPGPRWDRSVSSVTTRSRLNRWQKFNRWASSTIEMGAQRWGPRGGARTGIRWLARSRYALASIKAKEEVVWQSLVMKYRLPKVSSFALHPHSVAARNWSLLVALLLIIEVPVLPFQLAFISDERLLQLPWLLWFRLWVDLVFWLDTALQFFVQIQPEDRTYWITDIKQISWKYFRGRFVIDLLAVLPLKGLVAGIWRISSDQCVVSLVGFHRLLRFARWARAVSSLQAHESAFVGTLLQYKYKTKRLVRALVLVIFCTHVMGCFWASLAVCGSEDVFSWYEYLGQVNDGNELYERGTPVRVYMCALYWAVYTLTGIGYGDVVPVSPLEYLVAIFCMLAASLTWAWVVANIVSIIGSMQKRANENLHTLDYVNELLRDKSVQVDFGRRIREYFTKIKNIRDEDTMHDIIDELSPDLQVEVVHAVNDSWIEKVWWLRTLPHGTPFLVDLTQNMKAALHTPNETFPNRPELIIIRRGLCLHGGHLMTPGHVFGQDMLLNNEALRKPYLTLVLTFLHLLVITRADFEGVLIDHPEVAPHFRKAFIKYAVMRGILYYAEKYRSAQKGQRNTMLQDVFVQSVSLPMAVPRPNSRQRRSSDLGQYIMPGRRARRSSSLSSTAAAENVQRVAWARTASLSSQALSSSSRPPAAAALASGDGLNPDGDAIARELFQLNGQIAEAEEGIRARLRGIEGLADLLTEQARLLSSAG